MPKTEISELKQLIRKLQKENLTLKEANHKLKKERDQARSNLHDALSLLDKVGGGMRGLLRTLKPVLASAQAKIERFERDSPLSLLDIYK